MSRAATEGLRAEFVDHPERPVSPQEFELFCGVFDDHIDPERLRRMLRRRQLGEPLGYILGYQDFLGRRFRIDKRVYITDPELGHLVDQVVAGGKALTPLAGRKLTVVEFGVGCGSLAISVKRELPDALVIGVDLDPDAITVARENAAAHQADIMLIESDLFSGVPEGIVPDIVFGDPPWGDDQSIYDESRPAEHYRAMPTLSAFPVGGITAVHEALLDSVSDRGWDCQLLLNLGTLDEQHIERLAARTRWHEVLRNGQCAILRCGMHRSDSPITR